MNRIFKLHIIPRTRLSDWNLYIVYSPAGVLKNLILGFRPCANTSPFLFVSKHEEQSSYCSCTKNQA